MDGNQALPYLPEGFLIAQTHQEDLEDWHNRWSRASAASFTAPDIPHGPFPKTIFTPREQAGAAKAAAE